MSIKSLFYGTRVGQQAPKTIQISQLLTTQTIAQPSHFQIDKCYQQLVIVETRPTVNPSTSVSVGSSPTAPKKPAKCGLFFGE